MDLEKAIKKGWDKLEAEIGAAGPIEGQDREKLEEWVGECPDIEVAEFVEDYLYDLEKTLRLVKILKHLWEGKNVKSSTMAKTKVGVKAAQIANQRFQRRVAIVKFVLFRVYNAFEMFLPLIMNESLPRKCIHWKRMVVEWNQEYPSDIMTSANVFRTTFYRILREPEVLQRIIVDVMVGDKAFLQGLQSILEIFQKMEQPEEVKQAMKENPHEFERYHKLALGISRLYEILSKKDQQESELQ